MMFSRRMDQAHPTANPKQDHEAAPPACPLPPPCRDSLPRVGEVALPRPAVPPHAGSADEPPAPAEVAAVYAAVSADALVGRFSWETIAAHRGDIVVDEGFLE